VTRIPVLLYHSVSDDPSPALAPYTVRPTLFREHLETIAELGWEVVTIGELERRLDAWAGAADAEQGDAFGNADDRPVLAITFDDGFADNADTAAAIAADFAVAPTLYVTTGTVGRTSDWLEAGSRRPMASWQQLRDLVAAGWEIGAHGVSHVELDTVPLADARQEIGSSKHVLECELGVEAASFAYPHGYYSSAVRAAVIGAGYGHACAVKNAWSSELDDRFARARLTVTSGLSADALQGLLRRDDVRTLPDGLMWERTFAQAWRTCRRVRHRLRSDAR
jgi:peptidoglycan/xylan/chitin deacetylase (PgdA/CDA1 family)